MLVLSRPDVIPLLSTVMVAVAQEALRHYIGSLGREKMAAVCARLAIAVACDPHGQ